MATTEGEWDEQIPAVVLEQITTNAHAALRLSRRASMIVQSWRPSQQQISDVA